MLFTFATYTTGVDAVGKGWSAAFAGGPDAALSPKAAEKTSQRIANVEP